MEDMCSEMRSHLRMEREAPRASFYENVNIMAALQKQVLQGAAFILTHEAALRAAGRDPEADETMIMMKEQVAEVLQQMLQLSVQMQEDARAAKEAAAKEYVSRASVGDGGGHDSDGGEWDDV